MWAALSEVLDRKSGLKFHVTRKSAPPTRWQAWSSWETDVSFREFFNQILAEVPFSAFRWENPAATESTKDLPFEFVVLNSPELEREADPRSFATHFRGSNSEQGVVSFSNLGRDAILIVPCPAAEPSVYPHLATFVRGAPKAQQQELWRHVGCVVKQRLGTSPFWLSSAGAGVAWLHVRLDDQPKYYGYAPYRQSPLQPAALD